MNQAYASLLGSYFAVTAARLGITPTELLQRYPLRIAAQSVAGDVLAQGTDNRTQAAAALLEAGKHERFFQLKKSSAKDLAQIAGDKLLGWKVTAETITQMDGSEKLTGTWDVTPPGSNGAATLHQKDGKVWINVAGLATGERGSAVYDLAANYAKNNGLKFIGDPAGVSRAAMVRRTENMLSSAVKYGTTDHLEPHADQLVGNDTIPALAWKEGDLLGNIASMMEAAMAANDNLSPVAGALRYDAATDSLIDSEGQPFDADAIGELSDLTRAEAGAGAPGQATLRRDALYRSLVQGEGERRAFLEQLRRVGSDGSAQPGGGLDQAFYQGVGQRGAFSPSDNVLALFKGADLSTFIHESGHFFLEVQADLAARIQGAIDEGASVSAGEREIVDDTNRLLAWFGVKNTPERTALQQWHDMTRDEKRQHHEQFARGFEAYAFEGKAPSTELQSLFQRFRAWMVNIYRQLSGLNVELTDEVRSVMDRMIATGEQIQEAEAARQMGALFATPEQAGMTVGWLI